jgi:H/ACA ribonucleoprotein complex subunit 3
MRSELRICPACGRYSLEEDCPSCGASTRSPIPARFSPDDRYGEYRRTAIIQEYGENGKHHKI